VVKALALAVVLAALGCLGVYLFATAPPALGEREATAERIPIATVFAIVAQENAAARALYTKEIVQAGMPHGLRFGEDWRTPGVDAGPLPALFLRETGARLETSAVELRLFLGSDLPINAANRFTGAQADAFARVRATGQPVNAFAEDTALHTALFPDIAVTKACVDCHNDDDDSAKQDWRVGDIMGATTWTYPHDSVTPEELLQIVATLRGALADTYADYVARARSFATPPEIGDRWPRDGHYLPSPEVFAAEHARLASSATLADLLRTVGAP
jgi:adenylate cyclase